MCSALADPHPAWRLTLSSELDTVFFGTKFAWPHLVARGGGVVLNTASVAGMQGAASTPMCAHATGKAGVIGFTRQAAVEGAAAGIRVVSISPGPIETPATAAHYANAPETQRAIANRTLLGRRGQPHEVARLAVFLASDGASFLTGRTTSSTGGRRASDPRKRPIRPGAVAQPPRRSVPR
jgi:NAD(P)-dependent dehydrogenase (short-subunit alcohol dehydrogenase family)